MADLDRVLGQADRVPAPDLWPDIRRREPRKPPERRLGVAVVALILAVAGIAVASTAFFGERDLPATPVAPTLGVDPRVTAQIDVGRFPQEIAAGEGAVWVTGNEGQRWFLARIDLATNDLTSRLQFDEVEDVATGAGAVWAVGFDRETGLTVFRIDPLRGRIEAAIPLPCEGSCHPSQIATAENSVWVSVMAEYPEWGEVIRIDISSNTVAGRTRLPGDPRDLVVGEGGVWVYSLTHFTEQSVAGGTLFRLDPETGEVVATLLEGRIPPASGVNGPPVLAAGYGAVWTSIAPGRPIPLGSSKTEIVAIDPATNKVSGERITLGTLFLPFSVEAGGVWFRGGPEDAAPVISRLDPATRTIEDSFHVDGTVLDGAIDPATSTMWLTTYDGRVVRVDLR
jgi:hypothetical protein